MSHPKFEQAVNLMDEGKVQELKELLSQNPDLANSRDDGNASLLIRLIDWPGHRPRSDETARVLLEAGVEVDARRDDENGTALAGALCTKEIDLVAVFIEFGADFQAPLGWMKGTCFDLADRICQDQGQQNEDDIKKLRELFADASGKKVPTQTPFGGTTPLMFAKDVKAAAQFFTEKLGFHIDWAMEEDGSDPYLGISRGGAEFHLTRCKCSDERHTGNLWIRIECEQVDELYEEIKERGVNVTGKPVNQPWGLREMNVEDPDGNKFTFFGPTTS